MCAPARLPTTSDTSMAAIVAFEATTLSLSLHFSGCLFTHIAQHLLNGQNGLLGTARELPLLVLPDRRHRKALLDLDGIGQTLVVSHLLRGQLTHLALGGQTRAATRVCVAEAGACDLLV